MTKLDDLEKVCSLAMYGEAKTVAYEDRPCMIVFDCVTGLHARAARDFYIQARTYMPLLIRVAKQADWFRKVAAQDIPSIEQSVLFGNTLEYLREALAALEGEKS